MKKKFVLSTIVAVVAVVILTSSGIISKLNGGWIKVDDSGCNKCKITNIEYTCGKCGSSMSSSWKWDNKQEYMVYTFTCNNRKNTGCTHFCRYKTKP